MHPSDRSIGRATTGSTASAGNRFHACESRQVALRTNTPQLFHQVLGSLSDHRHPFRIGVSAHVGFHKHTPVFRLVPSRSESILQCVPVGQSFLYARVVLIDRANDELMLREADLLSELGDLLPTGGGQVRKVGVAAGAHSDDFQL